MFMIIMIKMVQNRRILFKYHPPPAGSSIVTVESTGYTVAYPRPSANSKRIDLSLLTMRFNQFRCLIGDNEAIHGKLHANAVSVLTARPIP